MIFTQTEQQKLSLIKKNLPVAVFISTTLRSCFPSKTTPLLEMKNFIFLSVSYAQVIFRQQIPMTWPRMHLQTHFNYELCSTFPFYPSY